jgi:hypothetical protein
VADREEPPGAHRRASGAALRRRRRVALAAAVWASPRWSRRPASCGARPVRRPA